MFSWEFLNFSGGREVFGWTMCILEPSMRLTRFEKKYLLFEFLVIGGYWPDQTDQNWGNDQIKPTKM